MAFSSLIKRLTANPAFLKAVEKAAAPAEKPGAGAISQTKRGIANVKRFAKGEKLERAPREAPAGGTGFGFKAVKKAVGRIKNPAEGAVESATKMKKGGAVDKMGRAVKRKTADVKGRAMKGK